MDLFNQPDEPTRYGIVFPFGRHVGHFSPENLAFNANLQEFSLRVNQIVGFHDQGRLTADEALHQLERLWTEFKHSKSGLRIGSGEP